MHLDALPLTSGILLDGILAPFFQLDACYARLLTLAEAILDHSIDDTFNDVHWKENLLLEANSVLSITVSDMRRLSVCVLVTWPLFSYIKPQSVLVDNSHWDHANLVKHCLSLPALYMGIFDR